MMKAALIVLSHLTALAAGYWLCKNWRYEIEKAFRIVRHRIEGRLNRL
jgi:hypothetical protein